MFADERAVAWTTAIDDLDFPAVYVIRMPVRPQLDDLVIQPRADFPCRAHDHPLARPADELTHLLRPSRPVIDDVV